MAKGLPPISYPVLFWHEGYIFLAEAPLNLCSTPRSSLGEAVERARAGKEHMIDAEGKYYDIVDWRRIPAFGGILGFVFWITGSAFTAPVLANEQQLTLPEFKRKIASAMRSRYAYDLDKYPGVETVRKLKAAQTYAEALDAVPKL